MRKPMGPARKLALASIGLLLMAPLSAVAVTIWHGFGPCGPANLAGLFGCFGFLVCIPAGVVLGFIAFVTFVRQAARDLEVSSQQTEPDRNE